jgi:hypothetical protein
MFVHLLLVDTYRKHGLIPLVDVAIRHMAKDEADPAKAKEAKQSAPTPGPAKPEKAGTPAPAGTGK